MHVCMFVFTHVCTATVSSIVHTCTLDQECLTQLTEFAVNAASGNFDTEIMHQIKIIGTCASLIMWHLHSANFEWPTDVVQTDVSEVAA